ncbi:13165_t:CDS:2 [Entrophospora sp. SA101]|nr:13165_t:CDS:2 [Entrophospora sp. SA101]
MTKSKMKLKTGDKVKVITGQHRGIIDYISRLDTKEQTVYLKKKIKRKLPKLVFRKKKAKSNPIAEKKTSCQSCEERKEQNICSACRQPEPEESEVLNFHLSFVRKKYLYEAATIMRDKLPVQIQTEFDQLLPQLKLSASEQELITKVEKFLSDFLAEKEFNNKAEEIFEKNPQNKALIEKKEVEEKIYKQIATNPDPNQKPNQKDQNQPNQDNNNSAKITQLQQEVNSLKQEIRDLKKPGNPSPANSDTLRDKERKLQEKEKELKKLSGEKNTPPSNNQTNNNSNLPLIIGGIIGVAGIICLIVVILLISQKKKKTIVYAYKKFQHSSPMQTTDIEKIVLNSGVSQAVNNKQSLENTEKALVQIAHGQKPLLTSARKSITGFKLREGMLIGCFSKKKFDQKGNYNLGVNDLNIFSTVPYDLTFKNQGVQITIVFKSSSAEENGYFLNLLGFPFKEKEKK